MTVTATDDAGNTNMSTGTPGSFSLFPPGDSASWTCNASGGTGGSSLVNCMTLAGQGTQDMPSDTPSQTVSQCFSGATWAFSGYADPSMRADPVIDPTFGPTIWMLYSYPSYNWSVAGNPSQGIPCSNTPTVETHLASSSTDSGASWQAWCQGADCDTATPIWPSEPYCTGSIPGISTSCTAQCAVPAGSPWSTCFSSHEVANFWPVYISPLETWFAVHLMYWVEQGTAISNTDISYGCLVVSESGTPTGLGWALGSGPNSCANSSAFPSNNSPLLFTNLTSLAQRADPSLTACISWGEPAITVAGAPSEPDEYAVYLASSCLDTHSGTEGYFIFVSQAFTAAPSSPAGLTWSYYAGPLPYSVTNTGTYMQNENQGVNSMTEFDWAVRADGTMVAVVTPEYVIGEGGASGEPFQYGCLVFNFDLTNASSPFGSLVATLNDTGVAGSSPQPNSEEWGSNGCTYDPMSNTGVVIVRRLLNSSYTHPLKPNQDETYTIMDTGVLP